MRLFAAFFVLVLVAGCLGGSQGDTTSDTPKSIDQAQKPVKETTSDLTDVTQETEMPSLPAEQAELRDCLVFSKSEYGCLFNMATRYNKTIYCDSIGNPGPYLECMLNLFNQLNYSGICGTSRSDFIDICQTALDAITEGDANTCDLIDENESRDLCIETVAFDRKDKSLCEKIVGDRSISCVSKIMFEPDKEEKSQVGSVQECDSLPDETERAWCIIDLAYRTGDLFPCSKLGFNEGRGVCLKNLAIKLKNESICNRISTRVDEESCYFEVAALKYDITICSRIRSKTYKTSCYNNVLTALGKAAQISKAFFDIGCEENDIKDVADYCYLIEGESLDRVNREEYFAELEEDLCFDVECEKEYDYAMLRRFRVNNSCDKIVNPIIKDVCLKGLLKCDNITTDHIKQECQMSLDGIYFEDEDCNVFTPSITSIETKPRGEISFLMKYDSKLGVTDMGIHDGIGLCLPNIKLPIEPNFEAEETIILVNATCNPLDYSQNATFEINTYYTQDGVEMTDTCRIIKHVTDFWDGL